MQLCILDFKINYKNINHRVENEYYTLIIIDINASII